METVRLSSPSLEQQYIIECIGSSNVIVDAVAGSGKTTCILHIARKYSNLKILLITYNAKLKVETREKVRELNILNLKDNVHTYHSFCVKNYSEKCKEDKGILKVLENNTRPKYSYNYDLIILDEAQDISETYFKLVNKIYNDNMQSAKICILGDMYQSIYSFNGADPRYIKYADQIFNLNNISWNKCPLSESFRITKEMSDFINKCMLNNNRIISNKLTNIKPNYIICDVFGDRLGTSSISRPFAEIKRYLNMGYTASDIFVLAPSIKNDETPVRILENKIKDTLKNIMVYVPISDEEKIDEEIMRDKIVFSSFHQAKGLERKVVLVFGFDEGYFNFHAKEHDRYVCPNTLYVATTRALEHLTVFHHYRNNYLPFINKDELIKYTNFERSNLSITKFNSKKNIISVTDLVNHISVNVIEEAITYLNIIKKRNKQDVINIPVKTEQIDTFESVSEITGTAIPSYFEYILKNKISIYDELCDLNYNCIEVSDGDDFIDEDDSVVNNLAIEPSNIKQYELNKIDIKNLSEDELLYIANRWCSYKSGYKFKVAQIKKYDWLSKENFKKCIDRLNSLKLTANSSFEKKVSTDNDSNKNNIVLHGESINGFIDCIDGNNIYEFKCIKEFDSKHYLQLATYMYLYESQKKSEIDNDIFNYKKELEKNENEIKNVENNKKYKIEMFQKNIERNDIKINEYTRDIEKFINDSNQKLVNIPNKTQKDIEKLQNKIKYNLDLIVKYTKKAVCKSMIPNLKKENINNNEKIIKLQNNNIDEVTDNQVRLSNEKIDEFKKCYNSKIEMLKEENKKYNLSICNLQQHNNVEELNKLKKRNIEIKQKILDLNNNKKDFKITNNYYLYNILNDEMFQIECSYEQLSKLIDFLITSKYHNKKGDTDEIFIEKSLKFQIKKMTQLNEILKKEEKNWIINEDDDYGPGPAACRD